MSPSRRASSARVQVPVDCMSHDIRAKASAHQSQGFRPPKNLLININDSVPRLFRARKEPHGFRGAGGPERSLKGWGDLG